MRKEGTLHPETLFDVSPKSREKEKRIIARETLERGGDKLEKLTFIVDMLPPWDAGTAQAGGEILRKERESQEWNGKQLLGRVLNVREDELSCAVSKIHQDQQQELPKSEGIA